MERGGEEKRGEGEEERGWREGGKEGENGFICFTVTPDWQSV